MNDKRDDKQDTEKSLKKGQGFNNARGEIEDTKDTPRGNGQNLDNDPSHQAQRQKNQKEKPSI